MPGLSSGSGISSGSGLSSGNGLVGGSWFRSSSFLAIDSANSTATGPGLIADFRTGNYAITNVATGSISAATAAEVANIGPAAITDLFTFTRAGSATYIDSAGTMQTAATDVLRFDYTNGVRQALLEGAATNLFLNSAVGATQNITTSAGAYVLSFYGTGSITCSGTSTATLSGTGATNRVQTTFTPTAGTLTLTVTGSITNVQFETGAVASSYIATAGTAVTRPADSCQLSAKALAVLARTAAGVVVQGQALYGSYSSFVGGTATRLIGLNAAQNNVALGDVSPLLSSGSLSAPTQSIGTSAGWDGSGRGLSYQGSSIATSGVALDTSLTSAYLGRASTGVFANGWYDRLIIYPFRPTNAAIVSKAAVYS